MYDNPFRPYLLTIGLFTITITLILVSKNTSTPGFCPTYPTLNLPACVVVLIYFIGVTVALLLPYERMSNTLFFTFGTLSILTGLYFSTVEITTPGQQCPQLFGIPLPLCFTVPPTLGLMMYLGWRGLKVQRQ